MTLALQLRSLLAPLFLASLPTLATAAPRDVVAPVAGMWMANSATSVALRGEVQDAAGAATHALSAALRGSAEGGLIAGSLTQVHASPQVLPALEYQLEGAYSRGIDGRLYFSADVRLDLGFLGLPATVKVGELSGVLQPFAIEPATRASSSAALSVGALPALEVEPLGAFGTCPGGLDAGVLVAPVPRPAGVSSTIAKRPVARSGLLLATLRFLE